MSTDTEARWVVAASGTGRVKHFPSQSGLRPVCGIASPSWIPLPDEAPDLPACHVCKRALDQRAIQEMERVLYEAQARLAYAAELREAAGEIGHGGLFLSSRSRMILTLTPPPFASEESRAAFEDAREQVRAWMHDAADALDSEGSEALDGSGAPMSPRAITTPNGSPPMARIWIDADLAPLAMAAVRSELMRAADEISTEALVGPSGAASPEKERLRQLAQLLGQLGASPEGKEER